MGYLEDYKSKLITVDDALLKVKSGDEIVVGLGASEPNAFLKRLHEINGKVKDVSVATCLPMQPYEYFMNIEYAESFMMNGWFYGGDMRKVHKNKMVSYIPNHLHLAGFKRFQHKKPDIFIGVASLMDAHGNISLGPSATYERDAVELAGIVILEVNKNVPRTFGDTIIPLNYVDFIIETDYELPQLPIVESSEKDKAIGNYIAEYIENGSTIQLGIGGIPNAVADSLIHKKDLGIHTEMFTEGMLKLSELGVINNSKKTLRKNKSVATFALGTKKLYDFINDNPAVEILDGHYVNDPYVIGQNYKMISINTSLEVDLTGQCASEAVGTRQFSGTGGQVDTAVGAQKSEGGKSFIALHSTANVKDADGNRVLKSKISPILSAGTPVTLSRNDVDYVVTEYGVAALRGTSVKERVEKLINIAHPDFRDELKSEADKLMIW